MTTHARAESLAESEPSPSLAHARKARLAWIVLCALWLGATFVFWGFEALPFMDLPAHAGLIALRHRFPSSPFEQQYFVLAANIGPYSLFRFLGEGFLRAVGPLGAVRALATLPLFVTPAALYFARRRLYGERSLMPLFVGIALSFGLMTMMGFASYLLGLAVLLIVLTLWLELMVDVDERRATPRREIELGVATAVLFVAHGHAFLLGLGLMTLVALFGSDERGAWRARIVRVRAFVPAIAIAAYAAFVSRAGIVPEGSAPLPSRDLHPIFQTPFEKLGLLLTPTMATRSGLDVIAGFVLWLLVAVAAYRTGRALAANQTSALDRASRLHARALMLCAVVVLAVFLVLPHSIGWFGFVDGRLVPLALYLLLMGVQRPLVGSIESWLDRASPVAAALMVSLTLAASYRFQHEARGYKEVLAHVPREARVLNLPVDPNSDAFTSHPFVHYDKLVLADRPIVVSDVWFHQGTALFPTAANPALHLPPTYRESNLGRIEWAAYRLEDWDFALIRTRPEGSPGPVPDAFELVAHEGGWRLYKIRKS